MLWCNILLLFILVLVEADEQNNFGGEIKNENIIEEQQRYVTLGPVRNGTQRAVFDEVGDNNNVEVVYTGEAAGTTDDFGGYDDNFVNLESEKDIWIPKQYRSNEKVEEKAENSKEEAPINTSASVIPSNSAPLKPIDEHPSKKTHSEIEPIQPAPAFPEGSQERSSTIAPVPHMTSPVPSTTIAPQETSPRRPTAPLRPTVRRPQQQNPAVRKEDVAADLRTGKCFASIFYISSPSPPKPRITFSHFAMTVSVDQCARTCHEFNCAIAHYDPATGRCQFNPSTAFALKKGQCPAWPAPHYRNNVVTPQPLRIFCVQCHRSRPSGRRGSIRRQHIGGHYRTRFLKTQYTGRLPQALQGTTFAKVHAASHPMEALTENITSGIIQGQLIKQPQSALAKAEETRLANP